MRTPADDHDPDRRPPGTSRRSLLTAGGGFALAAALAARGSNTGRAGVPARIDGLGPLRTF
jgi:hypothetical protein